MSQLAWRLDTLALETVGFWALVMVSGSSKVVHACMLSWVQLFATLWTVACQAPLSVEYSRHEYWSGLLCPPPGNLPDPGIEPTSLASPALADGFFFFFFLPQGCLGSPRLWMGVKCSPHSSSEKNT